MKQALLRDFEKIIQIAEIFERVQKVRAVMGSQIEAFISRGQQHMFPSRPRATLIRALNGASVIDPTIFDLTRVIFYDINAIKDFIGEGFNFPAITTKSIDNVTYSIERSSIEHIFNNLDLGHKYPSTDLSRRADVLRRFAHNNHLLAQLLREPDLLIGETRNLLRLNKDGMSLRIVMEPRSDTTLKIADMAVDFQNLPNFSTEVGGRTINIGMPAATTIRTTFDSKVVQVESLLEEDTIEQQAELFLSDRLQNIVVPMLSFLNTASGLSGKDLGRAKVNALKKYIAIAFRHYVFVPNDFEVSSEQLQEFHFEFCLEIADMIRHLTQPYGVSDPDINLVEDTIMTFVHNFIGTGDFINKASNVTYNVP